MSQDLTGRQKTLEYLKQRDLRQSIGYTGDGRLRNPTEKPEINASRCQPWAGQTTREGGVTGAQGLALLSKIETTADLFGECWSHCGATAAVGSLLKVERGGTLPATLQSPSSAPFQPSPTYNQNEVIRGQPHAMQSRAGESK